MSPSWRDALKPLASLRLTVVLLAVPILMRLKSKSWEPRMVAVISGAILAVGLTLFVERAFFGG